MSFNTTLEVFGQARLFEHGIGSMSRFDLVIDRESNTRVRRRPDFVIAFTWPLETATRLKQQALQFWRKVATHQCAFR